MDDSSESKEEAQKRLNSDGNEITPAKPNIDETHEAALTNARAVLPALGGLMAVIAASPVFGVLGAAGAGWALLQATRAQAYRAKRVQRFMAGVDERVQALGKEKLDQSYLMSEEYRDFLFDVFDAAAAAQDEAHLDLIVKLLVGSASRRKSLRQGELDREYAHILKGMTVEQGQLLRIVWRQYREQPYHEIAFENRYTDTGVQTKDVTENQWEAVVLEFFDDQEELPGGMHLRRQEQYDLRIVAAAGPLASSGILQRQSSIFTLTPFAVEMMAFLDEVTFDHNQLRMRPLRDGEDMTTLMRLVR